MSEHTPGPWVVNHDDALEVITADGDLISECKLRRWEMPRFRSTIPEMEANARLCAAAPDLLKQLDRLYQMYKTGGFIAGAKAPWEKDVRDAIAKARGTA